MYLFGLFLEQVSIERENYLQIKYKIIGRDKEIILKFTDIEKLTRYSNQIYYLGLTNLDKK